MDTAGNTITLYSPQANIVWRTAEETGTAYSRREYVAAKYEDCASIFLTAYDTYIREAEKIVPRPDDRAYPYWAFASMEQVDVSGGGRIMTLEVPLSEVILFDQYDWYKVLRLSYIGDNARDEADFARKLEMRGIRDSSDAVLRPFYPDIKREIVGSWKRLFRHDAAVKAALVNGETPEVRSIQAGLWCIRKDWMR